MSSVIARPLNLWTARHFAVMWPFLAGGFYVGLKFFELFRPSAISDEDKKNSRLLQQFRDRGIYWSWYPEHTGPAQGGHSEHHH